MIHSSALNDHQLSRRQQLGEWLLSLILTSIILLACLQIVLRMFFQSGLLWIDPLLRYLVLWVGFLGAVIATSRSKHICLDLLQKRLVKMRPYLQIMTDLFSLLASAGLAWASWLFIKSEIEFGTAILLGIPSWGWNLIFPLAFGLMTLQYLVILLKRVAGLSRPDPSQPGGSQP